MSENNQGSKKLPDFPSDLVDVSPDALTPPPNVPLPSFPLPNHEASGQPILANIPARPSVPPPPPAEAFAVAPSTSPTTEPPRPLKPVPAPPEKTLEGAPEVQQAQAVEIKTESVPTDPVQVAASPLAPGLAAPAPVAPTPAPTTITQTVHSAPEPASAQSSAPAEAKQQTPPPSSPGQKLGLPKAMPKVKFPIAFKLVGITLSLLILVTAIIAFRSSELFIDKLRQRIEDNSRTQAENRATEVEGLLNSYIDKIRVVASLLYKQYPTPADKQDAIDLTFKPDRDFVSVEIYKLENGQPVQVDRAFNADYLASFNLNIDYLNQLRRVKPFPMSSVFAGNIEIMNSSIPKGAPLITIGMPFVKDEYERVSHIAVANIRLDRIQKAFSALDASETFLVDPSGIVLAHPDDKLAIQALSMKDHPMVEKAMESKLKAGASTFVNELNEKKYYGVYNKTPFGVAVVSQIPEEIILEPAKLAQREAFYIGGIVLSGAIFLVFLFSISLTTPIEKLVDFTNEISAGNYDVYARKSIKTKDEVGDLATAFDDMTQGLRERAKAYKVMRQALGASVIETLMTMKEEELGGQRKHVSVLFSDLRDFTKFSEGHSPEEVVSMLNEYFDVMVNIIAKYGGWLDKFIGDAIMAVWGVPYTGEQDAAKATMAALEMRIALAELNGRRAERGQGPIKIGAGLHCGDAIVGKIGATERANLTVIGDTVNQASRIEASTKAFGTDILISQEMVDQVKDFFMLEYAGAAEVKGKAEPLKLYKVRGYIDDEGKEVPIRTPWSDYKAEAADKVKVA